MNTECDSNRWDQQGWNIEVERSGGIVERTSVHCTGQVNTCTIQRQQQVHDNVGVLGVEVSSRFVQQKHGRLVCEGTVEQTQRPSLAQPTHQAPLRDNNVIARAL